MASQRNAFKYPVGNGIPTVDQGRHPFSQGIYLEKQVFEEHRKFTLSDLNGKNIVEFIKRQLINLSVDSGKSFLTICSRFDDNKNGSLEPDEIWHHFQKLVPGLLTPVDFRTLIIPQLYGLKSTDIYTPEAIARLRLDYNAFIEWVMDAEILKEKRSSFQQPKLSEIKNIDFLTPEPNEIVNVSERRRGFFYLYIFDIV